MNRAWRLATALALLLPAVAHTQSLPLVGDELGLGVAPVEPAAISDLGGAIQELDGEIKRAVQSVTEPLTGPIEQTFRRIEGMSPVDLHRKELMKDPDLFTAEEGLQAQRDRCRVLHPVGSMRFNFTQQGPNQQGHGQAVNRVVSQCAGGMKYRIVPVINGRHTQYARALVTDKAGVSRFVRVYFVAADGRPIGSAVHTGRNEPSAITVKAIIDREHQGGAIQLVDQVDIAIVTD